MSTERDRDDADELEFGGQPASQEVKGNGARAAGLNALFKQGFVVPWHLRMNSVYGKRAHCMNVDTLCLCGCALGNHHPRFGCTGCACLKFEAQDGDNVSTRSPEHTRLLAIAMAEIRIIRGEARVI